MNGQLVIPEDSEPLTEAPIIGNGSPKSPKPELLTRVESAGAAGEASEPVQELSKRKGRKRRSSLPQTMIIPDAVVAVEIVGAQGNSSNEQATRLAAGACHTLFGSRY